MLQSKKLSLVVDLDQTIIQATVDPTIAEWREDPDNPNYGAVKDVQSFQLLDEGPARGCWYHIKLRPGLRRFLDEISKLYEMHIYTMGTRAYAMEIAKIVDPEKKLFGDRILSRDESGSMTAKNLHRLFPVDTRMVVIIDDRGDVWNWSHNLVKVRQFEFFVGIGDINSTFLPKREAFDDAPVIQEVPLQNGAETVALEVISQPPQEGEVANGTSPAENIVSIALANDPETIQRKTEEQGQALANQISDRPLLQKQKMLDEADDEANKQAEGEEETQSQTQRHRLLSDDDEELHHVEHSLKRIHSVFYDEYQKNLPVGQNKRLALIKGDRSPTKKNSDTDILNVPDVSELMQQIKDKVLRSVNMTFSGVLPIAIDILQ